MAKYTITLDNQGANVSAGTSQVTVVAGNNMTAIAIPSKRGYTFGGYYTLPKGEGTQYYSPTGASARVWDDIDSVSRTAMTRHYNKKISDTCEDAQIRAVVG